MASDPFAGDWSGLPPTILSGVGKRLESSTDIFRFRSVCQNWRSSINPNPNSRLLSPFLPCKISNPNLPFNKRPNDPLLLVARAVFLVKPIRASNDGDDSNWILTVEEIVPGKLRILYPLSDDYVKNLPSNFPKSLNLLEFSLSEIAKSHSLKYADGEDVSGVQRVVLCSDCTAMVLYGEGILAGVRIKNGNWSYVRASLTNSSFSDVICVKGLVYAGDSKGNLYTVDHKTMRVIKVVAGDLYAPFVQLVNLKGVVFLVSRTISCGSWKQSFPYSVYRLDTLQHNWVSASLGLGVLFVNNNCSFFVHTQDVDKDCVVHSGSRFDGWGGHSFDVKRFEGSRAKFTIGFIGTGLCERFYNTQPDWYWIADMLWPPPIWFWTDAYSSSGEDEENDEWNPSSQVVSIHYEEVLPPCLAVGSSSGDVINYKQETNGITKDSVLIGDSHASEVELFELINNNV